MINISGTFWSESDNVCRAKLQRKWSFKKISLGVLLAKN